MPALPADVLAHSLSSASQILKLMANEQRLLILCHLSNGEKSVGELTALLGLNQSATSQHLQKLRLEGVLTTRRAAQSIYYRLADKCVSDIMAVLCYHYGPKP